MKFFVAAVRGSVVKSKVDIYFGLVDGTIMKVFYGYVADSVVLDILVLGVNKFTFGNERGMMVLVGIDGTLLDDVEFLLLEVSDSYHAVIVKDLADSL